MSEDLGDKFCEIREMIAAILASEVCFCLKNLAVNGRDLMGVGIAAGPELGEMLQLLLEKVIDGEVANEREALIEAVSQIYD
jgi:hypothetical protein